MEAQAPQQFRAVSMAAPSKNRPVLPVAFFDADGNPVTLDATDDVLTGYVAAVGRTDVVATDTVKQAIQKVEGKTNAPGDAVGAGCHLIW